MQYAIIGDIHSSKEDLKKVLNHINKQAPDAVLIGTGDLFECTISKRNITEHKYSSLSEVMLLPDGFKELLTFPSVRGNQEERILLITEANDPLLKMLSEMPEKMELGNAEVIHGHQWTWGGEPWSLLKADTVKPLTFYGHSHQSGFVHNGKEEEVLFEHPKKISDGQTLVNVGAVVNDREWVLYDSTDNTVTFMKAE
ncbi:metallophosphoesterase family protein [Sporosarcina highlanderae]|uniref:Metallophosphoesterase family protein n=1 Tax=Sporosarcina highlanderae TaxID=3035916 RepID=A0ABT8JU73_9BACL|nr:metallophosphoesterase family protein [Sporosarcina highlanderae]MDN4608695.1 metallophosphoesterase family protein [Sporosarcina highlanderae]